LKGYRLSILVTGAWFAISCSNALAAGSGGYRSEITDAGAMGMGSAFVGEADTPVAVYYNPAGTTQIKKESFSDGITFIEPEVDYTNPSTGDVTQMRRDNFIAPHAYWVLPVGQKWALGYGSGSYWGLGTDWAPDSFARYATTKSELLNDDTMLTAAYQVTPRWSMGVSADNDYSKASVSNDLNQGYPSVADAHSQLKGKDDTWGYRIATLFKINDQNQVGLMYRSAMHHEYRGKLYLDGLSTDGADLADAFGGSSYETAAYEKTVLPQSIVMGYNFKPTSKWKINLDIEWFDWSRFKQELISYPNATGIPLQILTASDPISTRWHSAWSESIGTEYEVTDRFRVRAGYFHQEKVEPDTTFNPSTPDLSAFGLTTGFGYTFNKHLSIDIAYVGIIYQPRKISNTVGTTASGDPTLGDISGKYTQYTNLGMATVTYKF
jgi:long-chain fatty acid transport protein